MSKGGGGNTPTSSTVTQSNLPDYASPYFTQLMGQGLTQMATPYQQYQGQQVANTSPFQQAAQGAMANMQAVPDATNLSGQMATNVGNQAAGFGVQNWTDPGVAAQYMSPYTQNVMQTQESLMSDQNKQQLNNINSQAVQAGAFGGDRQAIADAAQNKTYQQNLGAMQANALQSAYGQGQQTFLGTQQQAIQAGLGSMQNQLGAASQLAQTGAQQQAQGLNWINGMNTMGATQQQQQQNLLNTSQNNFSQAQNYNTTQLGNYGNLLHGIPVGQSYTQTNLQAAPSTTGMLGGLGALAVGGNQTSATK
jgi:hypothetical protein